MPPKLVNLPDADHLTGSHTYEMTIPGEEMLARQEEGIQQMGVMLAIYCYILLYIAASRWE